MAVLLVLFGAPVFGVASGLWLMRAAQTAEAAAGAPPLAGLCWQVPFQWWSTDLCGAYQHAVVLAAASALLAALVLLLIGIIGFAGMLARRSERFLVAIFAPAARLLVLSLALVILIEGAILGYAVFALSSGVWSGGELVLPPLLAWAAIVVASSLLLRAISAFRPPLHMARGVILTRETQPALWRTVDDIAHALDTPVPRHIVAGLGDEFYVTANGLALEKQDLRGETLHLSLLLMRVLSVDELRAVIGHELSHFKGRDAAWSIRFAPVFVGLQDAEERMRETEGWGVFAILPAMLLLNFFLSHFAIAERLMHRRRELEADRLGASVTRPVDIAAGLTRVLALGYVRRSLRRALQGHRLDTGQTHNLPAFFAYWAGDYFASNDAAKILKSIAGARLPHPVDTHPPLHARLEALGVAPGADAAWLVVPQQPSSTLIDGVEEIEIALSRAEVDFQSHIGNQPMKRPA